MANQWFRLHDSVGGDTGDQHAPEYVRSMGLDYTAQKSHPNGSPIWVVRVYGTSTELNDLRSKNNVVELSRSEAKKALDKMFGVARTADEWEDRFQTS